MKRNMTKSGKIAYGAMLVALAMIFSYVESLIPISIGIPGIKLGVANLVTVLGVFFLGPCEVLTVVIMRICLVGFMFGNGVSIIYSLAGGLISLAVMLIKKTDKFSMVSVSVAGGISHNIGQLLAAAMVLKSTAVVYYLPPLLVAGTLTGLLIGIVAQKVFPAVGLSGKNFLNIG